MTAEERIAAGVPVEEALAAFRDGVNRPGTIFSTDHWLLPKLQRLRELFNDPITADQAKALLDVLYQRHWMRDLMEWLEAPPMPWSEFFEYREVQQRYRKLHEREEAWEQWLQFERLNELNASERPQNCPDCGSNRILPIAYGLPTPDTEEAARRGKVILGGCMFQEARWHCSDCFNSWPESSEAESSEATQLSGSPESQKRYLMEMAAEWASIETESLRQPSAGGPSVVNYWDRADGRRVFLLKTVSGEAIRMEKLLHLQPHGGPPVYTVTHCKEFDERLWRLAAVAARRFERRLPS